jgi:hypothetical protein
LQSSAHSDENPFQTEIQYILLQGGAGASSDVSLISIYRSFRFVEASANDKSGANNGVVAVGASDKLVVIARRSGLLSVLPLPSLRGETRHRLATTPVAITINCTSTLAAIVDHTGSVVFRTS